MQRSLKRSRTLSEISKALGLLTGGLSQGWGSCRILGREPACHRFCRPCTFHHSANLCVLMHCYLRCLRREETPRLLFPKKAFSFAPPNARGRRGYINTLPPKEDIRRTGSNVR